ncbi:hypothetical protein NEOLEDRAFT_1178508 [Neolentinus lepideus HHB14362 ss-1]|uniref:Uncharacterized protein n=1 Tax=Neolentinus lepideus HHB14362 ss-1 TaxID=1314782 RepID=A0A165SN50_9AGAM|nr:hypothetical protein NEOLEDRAFT_1178508 [Neolentinus lepideus HHB14362 ss-1]
MSSLYSSLTDFAWLSRLVQRTFGGPGNPFAPDPGGSGWFASFLRSSPRLPPPTRIQLYTSADYLLPPSGTLGAGPCDGVIASLVLVVGVFVLFTAIGPFNRTRQGGFLLVAWIVELMSYVFPLLSTFPAFQSALERDVLASCITQGLVSILPDVHGLFSDVTVVANLAYVSLRVVVLNPVHLTTSSGICPRQTNKAIASAQVLPETVAEDCTDECPASALPASQSADVLDIVECIRRKHGIAKGKQKEEYHPTLHRYGTARALSSPSAAASRGEVLQDGVDSILVMRSMRASYNNLHQHAQYLETGVHAHLEVRPSGLPERGASPHRCLFLGRQAPSIRPRHAKTERHLPVEHVGPSGLSLTDKANIVCVPGASRLVSIYPNASLHRDVLELREDGTIPSHRLQEVEDVLEDMRKLRRGVRNMKRKRAREFESISRESSEMARRFARVREELRKGLEDARGILSSLSVSTTSTANHSVALPFAPADTDDEGDNWEAEVERCAQELVESEQLVEEGTSESEVADIVLSAQPFAASRPILCANAGYVHEHEDSRQANFLEDIARGAQAVEEAVQGFEESIPEAESNDTPSSDPQAAVGESPISDVEDFSVFSKPEFLRNLAAVDPTVLGDRDFPPEHDLLDSDDERLETEEQCEEALARWDEEDKDEEEALGHYDIAYPLFGILDGGEDDGEVDMEIEEDDYRQTFPTDLSLPTQMTISTDASGPRNDEEDTMPSYGSLEPLRTAYEEGEWQPINNTEPPFSHLSVSDSF